MRRFLAILAALLPIVSCSSLSKLQEGEFALKKGKIFIEGDSDVKKSDISPYVRTATVFNDNLAGLSAQNIETHLRYLGYYNSVIKDTTVFKGRKARTSYVVTPGRRYRIDSLSFNIPGGSFEEDFYADTSNLSIGPGNWLSEKDLEDERARSTEYFRSRGYYDINKSNYSFEADTVTHPGKLYLSYNVKTRDVPAIYHIKDVRLILPEDLDFNEKILKENNIIHPGDVYDEKKLNTAYSRFSNLRLFNSVSVEMTPADSALVDCDIKFTPSQQRGVKFNFEASTNSTGLLGFSPQITYYNKSLFNGGEWFNLGINGNYQYRFSDKVHATEFGISTSLSLPRFLGVSTERFQGVNIPRTDFSASFTYQDRPEYTRTLWTFSYGYTGRSVKNGTFINYQFNPLRLNSVHVINLSEEFLGVLIENYALLHTFSDYLDAGVSGNLMFSDVQNINTGDPHKYARVAFDLSGNVLSLFNKVLPYDETMEEHSIFGVPYSQYARIDLTLGQTWSLGKGHSLASRLQAGVGVAYGNSFVMPYEKQFYAGGSYSMRAWQSRTLGPGAENWSDFFVIPSQSGAMKLELGLEYRFPLVWKLEGALFAETGNIWNIKTPNNYYDENDPGIFRFKDFHKSLAADWGLGLRLNFDFVILRIDAGFKLREPSREQPWLSPADWIKPGGYGLQFGVGYPF